MSHINNPLKTASPMHHRFIRAIRTAALGTLGAFALGSMIQPAHAVLELSNYTLNWAGSNGYSMTGTLSVDSSITTPIIDASQLWDMSVSFYGPGQQLLSTWTQVSGGNQVYDYLTFSFDRQELLVNQQSIDVGWDTGTQPNEFYLYNSEGLSLYSVGGHDFVSFGGTVTMNFEAAPNTAPTLQLPTTPLVVEASFPGGAFVNFVATASDLEDEVAPKVTTTPVTGSVFSIGSTTVNASATDGGGLTTTGSFVVEVQDTTGPVIELNSNHCSEVLTVALGTDFSDPGASAFDAVDQSVGVSVSGTVDTSTLGNYTLTYTASDSRGNAATPVIRTVSVVDPMPGIPKRRFNGGNLDAHGDFNVSAMGNITARLNIAGQAYRSVFPFQERSKAVVFRGPKGVTILATVSASVNGAADPVLLVQTPTTSLELRPTVYTFASPAPATVAGTYTAVLRGGQEMEVFSIGPVNNGPMGSGFATFTVGIDGRVRTAGRTAEGTAITGSSYLVRPACKPVGPGPGIEGFSLENVEHAPAAEFNLYTGLYRAANRGSFGAVFTLDRSNPSGSISGEFRWSVPQGALAIYPEGFEAQGGAVGGRYEVAVPEGRIGLEFSFQNTTPFVAFGTVLAHPAFYDMSTMAEEQRVLGLRCRFTPGTGVLTGARYRGSAARNFQAIWLQEQGIIEGFGLSGDGLSHGIVQLMEVPQD